MPLFFLLFHFGRAFSFNLNQRVAHVLHLCVLCACCVVDKLQKYTEQPTLTANNSNNNQAHITTSRANVAAAAAH